MQEEWEDLRETWQRIRWARTRAKFERAKDAADSLGIKDGTYRTYERPTEDAGRTPPLMEARKIGRKFKVNWVWLVTGEGSPTDSEDENPRIRQVTRRMKDVPAEKQDDALAAVEAVIQSFSRRNG